VGSLYAAYCNMLLSVMFLLAATIMQYANSWYAILQWELHVQ